MARNSSHCKRYRHFFDSSSSSLSDGQDDFLDTISHGKSNFYYKLLLNEIKTTPTGIESIANEIGALTQLIFDSFVNVRQLTKTTKFVALQYKIIHRIVACNSYLFRCKIKNTDKCSFCNESDSISHFFFDCENTRSFWKDVENWENELSGTQGIIDKPTVILGEDPHDSPFLAHIILFGKWFIYKSKIASTPLNIAKFRTFLREQYKIERYSLIINHSATKEKFFNTFWNQII